MELTDFWFGTIAVLWIAVPQIMKLRGKKTLVEEG